MIPEQAAVVWTRRQADTDGTWHRVGTVSDDAIVSACLRVLVAPVEFCAALVSGAIPCLTCVSNKAALLRPH